MSALEPRDRAVQCDSQDHGDDEEQDDPDQVPEAPQERKRGCNFEDRSRSDVNDELLSRIGHDQWESTHRASYP
jgi:hypothetical protein